MRGPEARRNLVRMSECKGMCSKQRNNGAQCVASETRCLYRRTYDLTEVASSRGMTHKAKFCVKT